MSPSNETRDRNRSNSGSKSIQAAGRQSKNDGSRTPRGAASNKSAQRRGGQHSQGGR